MIKGVSGATRFLDRDEESALTRWELCGSEVPSMILSFEGSKNQKHIRQGPKQLPKHHDDTQGFRMRFTGDVQKLSGNFMINPFVSNNFTVINNSNIIFDDGVKDSIRTISKPGGTQFQEFWSQRLVKAAS